MPCFLSQTTFSKLKRVNSPKILKSMIRTAITFYIYIYISIFYTRR
ncbi:hypothetical protein NC652_000385 [Populus alba x Populus x berolinensis]|nr:hypothetical protein NC652_000385 [Populus alba x Populus x berolinensis]